MRLLWSEVECWRYYVSECVCIQWNLCNPDANGAEESVIVSEVSSFQRLSKSGTWGGKRCPHTPPRCLETD